MSKLENLKILGVRSVLVITWPRMIAKKGQIPKRDFHPLLLLLLRTQKLSDTLSSQYCPFAGSNPLFLFSRVSVLFLFSFFSFLCCYLDSPRVTSDMAGPLFDRELRICGWGWNCGSLRVKRYVAGTYGERIDTCQRGNKWEDSMTLLCTRKRNIFLFFIQVPTCVWISLMSLHARILGESKSQFLWWWFVRNDNSVIPKTDLLDIDLFWVPKRTSSLMTYGRAFHYP